MSTEAADIKAAMMAADHGQCIYYLEARIKDSTKDPSGLQRALKDFKDGVAAKFTPKFGASAHPDAVAARAKYDALLKAADDKLVQVLELQDILKMEDAIKGGNDNRPYYLENRTKTASDSKDIKRYLDPVKVAFAAFTAKYGDSKRAEAQKIVTEIGALIRNAEAVLPQVLEDEDIKLMGERIKDGNNNNLYYLGNRANGGPAADIRKYLALVKPPYDAFMAKYGASKRPLALKYIAEAEPVVRKAEEALPLFVEKEEMAKMIKDIDVSNNVYYLEARLKSANDAKEIKKYLDLVAPPFRLFQAKYGAHPSKEAKDAIAKYEPIVRRAEELIPFVAEGQEVSALAAKCDEGQAVWYLERQLKEPGGAELLQKRLDAIAVPFRAFTARFGSSTRDDVKAVRAKYEPLIAAAQAKLGGASETDAIAKAVKDIDPDNHHYYVSARVRDGNNSELLLKHLNPMRERFGAFKAKWGSNPSPEVKAAIDKFEPLIVQADGMVAGMQEVEALQKDVREQLEKDQVLYYLTQATKTALERPDADLLSKRIDAVERVLTPFQAKWGASSHDLAKKTIAEFSGALKAAQDVLPRVREAEDVKQLLVEVNGGSDNNTYYLENAIKAADDLERLQKYIGLVSAPYHRFRAKYGASDIQAVKEAIVRYDALLKTAEELVPVVAASADCTRLIKAIDGDSGDQHLYYLEKAVESANDAERLRKYMELVEPPFQAFLAKYGTSDNAKAKECKAKVEKLMADAAAVLPAVIERAEIAAFEKTIEHNESGGGSSTLWHLQRAIERADSVDDLKKYSERIRAPFDRFVAKFGSSPRDEAKKVMDKFNAPLKQAAELIPVVLVNDDMFQHIRACEGDPGTGASSNLWYLEKAVQRADSSETLQKYLDLVRPKYDAFVAKYGGSDHTKAKECVEKVGGLLKQANDVLPRIVELEGLQRAELAIDKDGQLWYLQKAIERADDVNALNKGIGAIKPGFEAFAAKYRTSALPQAAAVIAKYEPVLKRAEELVPIVIKDQDMFV